MRLSFALLGALVALSACNRATEPSSPEPAAPATGASASGQEQAPAAPPAPPANGPPRVTTQTPPDVAAPPSDAQRTASGLASKVIHPGSGGAHPTPTNVVRVHYSGWTTDGNMFDSSVTRGEPTEFPLNRVIAGWTEGVQLMVPGEVRRFWIPENLAYGGRPGAPQGMLVFDVELIAIVR